MANPLFAPVRPEKLAANGQRIETKGKISDFPRLVEIVEVDLQALPEEEKPTGWRESPVAVRLDFGWKDDRQQVPGVEGRVSAQIPAVCQRCLQVFELSSSAGIRMLLVRPGESPDFGGYESWELEGKDLRLVDLVEEVLVMALPLAAKHDKIDLCNVPKPGVAATGTDVARPFADLRAQMEKPNK